MSETPDEEDLQLVARHGSGAIERALAAVQLAQRRGREDDLRHLVDAITDDDGDGGERA